MKLNDEEMAKIRSLASQVPAMHASLGGIGPPLTEAEIWALKQINGSTEWNFVVTGIKRARGWTHEDGWTHGSGYPSDWYDKVLAPGAIRDQLFDEMGEYERPMEKAQDWLGAKPDET